MIELSTPPPNPIWWVVKPTKEVSQVWASLGITGSTSYVLSKTWHDARSRGATELGLMPEQVICERQ